MHSCSFKFSLLWQMTKCVIFTQRHDWHCVKWASHPQHTHIKMTFSLFCQAEWGGNPLCFLLSPFQHTNVCLLLSTANLEIFCDRPPGCLLELDETELRLLFLFMLTNKHSTSPDKNLKKYCRSFFNIISNSLCVTVVALCRWKCHRLFTHKIQSQPAIHRHANIIMHKLISIHIRRTLYFALNQLLKCREIQQSMEIIDFYSLLLLICWHLQNSTSHYI